MRWSLFTFCFYLEGAIFAEGKEKASKNLRNEIKKLNYCFQGAA